MTRLLPAPPCRLTLALALFAGLALAAAAPQARAETVALEQLAHIHGMAADPMAPSRLYLATHEGLFLATPDGLATRVGSARDDFMAFTAHPAKAGAFYVSGHPQGGGNLGILTSSDGGKTWQRLSPGAGGPVDFHAMAVSRADPKTIYGSYGDLQVSRDGGRTWTVAGPLPRDTIDLAASSLDAETLYAGARGGLFVSPDGGASWRPAFVEPRPVPLVEVLADGRVFAFVYGLGLVMAEEPALDWALVSAGFGDRYLLHLAGDYYDPQRLYAVADTGAVLTSRDGGKIWTAYEGSHRETPAAIQQGSVLFADVCQACHGERGMGERPEDIYAKDEAGNFVAPPLDDSAHGWHHSDRDLVKTILEGSPRNPRMIAWNAMLSEDDARNLVAYIKSLWSFRSLACQGARHMACMGQ